MPLINTAVPNLIQGVSQQPDATRFAGQCDEQLNAVSSIVEGLKKRPPMQFIGNCFQDTTGALDKDIYKRALIRFIERDNQERYVIILHEGKLRIFRLEPEGEQVIEECRIQYGETSYLTGVTFGPTLYLYSLTSDQNIKTLTVGDTTILINTSKPVYSNLNDLTPPYKDEAVIYVKQGDYNKKYKVRNPRGALQLPNAVCQTGDSTSDGQANDTGTGSGATSSGKIVDNLVPKINAWSGHTAVKIDDAHFKVSSSIVGGLDTLSVSDDLNGRGLGLVYREVDSITELPLVGINDMVVKVIGDAELDQDDYYVKFVTTGKDNGGITQASVGKGNWVETVAPAQPYKLGLNTPLTLINTTENVFILEKMQLGERTVGDERSNPFPSFVGSPLSNVFLFKGRLGFLSEDGVILTEAGLGETVIPINTTLPQQSFNFFRTTVTTLLDSDPIDVRVSNRNVTTLRAAQPFQEDLMIFSDDAQFKLSGRELLTPKSVSISQVTSFDYNRSVEPLPLGAYMYFPFDRGIYSGIREYTVNAINGTFDSDEITQHVPQYVPKGLTSLTGSAAENLIALCSGDITYSDDEPYFNDGPSTFSPFDYAVIRYSWSETGGQDLDTRTQVVSPYSGESVGWSRSSATVGLDWASDNTGAGTEAVLVDFVALAAQNSTSLIDISLRAFWYASVNTGDFTIQFETYLGGTMQADGAFNFVNSGGTLVNSTTIGRQTFTQESSDINGDLMAILNYNPITKTARLQSL